MLIGVLASALAGAETVDRVVAAVGNRAITASDVETEYRTELLLEGKVPDGGDPDASTLGQVRDRLIDRILLEEEAAADGVEVRSSVPAVDERFKALVGRFSSPSVLSTALSEAGLNEDAVRDRFAEEEQVLRVIDDRLRPLATVEPSEIESYYRQTLMPDLARQGRDAAPPLAEVESRIREIVTQQKIDRLLADWLKTLRATHEVHVYDNPAAEDHP